MKIDVDIEELDALRAMVKQLEREKRTAEDDAEKARKALAGLVRVISSKDDFGDRVLIRAEVAIDRFELVNSKDTQIQMEWAYQELARALAKYIAKERRVSWP